MEQHDIAVDAHCIITREGIFCSIVREQLKENKIQKKMMDTTIEKQGGYVVRVRAFLYAYSRERKRQQGQTGCR